MGLNFWRPKDSVRAVEVDEDNPFPVQVIPPPTSVLPTVVRRATVPGVVTGAAYAALDQIGTLIEFPNVVDPIKRTGMVVSGRYYDYDDEGLQVDLHLFSRAVTAVADNAALDLADTDTTAYIGTLSFTVFNDFASGQTSVSGTLALGFGPLTGTSLYGLAQARGALNIAAGNIPQFVLVIWPDL